MRFFQKNEKYAQISIYAFLVLASVILFTIALINLPTILLFFQSILQVLSPLIYGAIFAYLINPLMRAAEKWVFRFPKGSKAEKKLKRPLSVALGMLVFLMIVSIMVLMIFPQVTSSFMELTNNMNNYVKAAQKLITRFTENSPLLHGEWKFLDDILDFNDLSAAVSKGLNNLITDFTGLLSTASTLLLQYAGSVMIEVKNVLIGLIVAIYFLLAKERIICACKKAMATFLNRRHYINCIQLARYTHKTVGGFLIGKIIDSIIIGILTFIVMMIFRMPFAPLISVIVAVTNVIPVFGPFLGAIPAAFIIFIAKPSMTIWFILMILIIQQLDGNVIGPKILGDSTGLSALGVLIAITVAGGFFGVPGMILGVPAAAVLCAISKELADRRLRRKNASTCASDYLNDPPMPDFQKDTILTARGEALSSETYPPVHPESEEDTVSSEESPVSADSR